MNDPDIPNQSLVRAADAAVDLFPAELDAARSYAEAAKSAATRRAYDADWRIYSAWCTERRIAALPSAPELVAVFLAAEAERGIKPATIARRLAAIGHMHACAGFPAPSQMQGAAVIREVLAGIRRTPGSAPARKKAADGDVLRDLLRAIEGDGLRAKRDRALLALGMAASLRRSELVALQVPDLAFEADGLRLRIARSKTDQEGAGALIAVPSGRRIRPVELVRAWLDDAGHASGPLFRRLTKRDTLTDAPMSDRAVARLVQGCARQAGLNPAEFAAHSLRAGFLTEAARQGASIFKMREVSRHKSVQVLAEYVREADLFRDHAGERFL